MVNTEVIGKATMKPAKKLLWPENQEAKAMMIDEIKIFPKNHIGKDYPLRSLYSMASTKAFQEASIMFLSTPTVVQSSCSS